MDMYQMFVLPAGTPGEAGAELMARSGRLLQAAAVKRLELAAPDLHVLEIGFGPGVGLALLADTVPQGHVTGVDPSELMHRHAAQRNSEAIAAGRMTLIRSTADTLPLPDDSQDAAMMIDNLHFWPDPVAGLREVSRVLAPGGAVVCGFSPPSGGPPNDLARMFDTAGFVEIESLTRRGGFLLRARTATGADR